MREEWEEKQFRDCNGVSNGIDLPKQVLQLENELGGVAGEALGAEKTFDISNVGGGAFGPGKRLYHYHYGYNCILYSMFNRVCCHKRFQW